MKQIIITVLVVVGIIAGAIVFGGGDEQLAGAQSNNFYGKEDGVITVTEFGDFECPGCASFFPIFSQVKEEFKDQVRFEFKHFPLVQIHQNATTAHRAAQAAANQGKFWEMHDMLYQGQLTWRGQATSNPGPIFEGYARQIGLDMDKFNAEAAQSDTLSTINADIADGKAKGASSTPTFYLDGVQIEDLSAISTPATFAAVIQEAIDAKTGQNSDDSPETEPTEATKPENLESTAE